MTDKTKTVKVTFTLAKGRTHTHAGVKYHDGDSAEVSPRHKDKLAKRGVLAGVQAPKADG